MIIIEELKQQELECNNRINLFYILLNKLISYNYINNNNYNNYNNCNN